jgi:hypothetical protein
VRAPPDQPCASHAKHAVLARARVQGGATHGLRDGDEADADERQGALGVAAGPGEGRQSDPSRGSEARHAHARPPARTPEQARTSVVTHTHTNTLHSLADDRLLVQAKD